MAVSMPSASMAKPDSVMSLFRRQPSLTPSLSIFRFAMDGKYFFMLVEVSISEMARMWSSAEVCTDDTYQQYLRRRSAPSTTVARSAVVDFADPRAQIIMYGSW